MMKYQFIKLLDKKANQNERIKLIGAMNWSPSLAKPKDKTLGVLLP